MHDIVIDTNVFVHANNPQAQENRQESSIELLLYIQSSTELICLDEGVDSDESRNRSLVLQEYLRHIKQGDLGFVILFELLTSERIKEVKTKTSQNISKKINKIKVKPRDKTFIKVAFNSTEQILVSHDFEDFHDENRKKYKDEIGISILIAQEALEAYCP